jgi:hypothetical protein
MIGSILPDSGPFEFFRSEYFSIMETNVRKILLRSLITLFSILLIIILNTYLNYRLEKIPERNAMVKGDEMGYENRFIGIMTAWDNYSPTDVNRGIVEINRRTAKGEDH